MSEQEPGQEAGHPHCDSCYSVVCEGVAGCEVVACPACGVPAHFCKLEDHALVCPEQESSHQHLSLCLVIK